MCDKTAVCMIYDLFHERRIGAASQEGEKGRERGGRERRIEQECVSRAWNFVNFLHIRRVVIRSRGATCFGRRWRLCKCTPQKEHTAMNPGKKKEIEGRGGALGLLWCNRRWASTRDFGVLC